MFKSGKELTAEEANRIFEEFSKILIIHNPKGTYTINI